MSTHSNALSSILFGQIRGGVLALLHGRPDKSFYVRQIARELPASVGAVQRELEKLAKVGLIVRTSVGNHVFYQVNQRHPVYPEMRTLVAKTIGVFSVLHSALEPHFDRITLAFVYGSVARQEETAESDLDVMIVGDITLDELLSGLSEVEASLGRPVNSTVYSIAEFRLKLKTGNHFLNTVVRGKKVFLIGNEDDLRKVGGIRMAEAGGQQRKRNRRSVENRAARSR